MFVMICQVPLYYPRRVYAATPSSECIRVFILCDDSSLSVGFNKLASSLVAIIERVMANCQSVAIKCDWQKERINLGAGQRQQQLIIEMSGFYSIVLVLFVSLWVLDMFISYS